jgi:hypothetical protein
MSNSQKPIIPPQKELKAELPSGVKRDPLKASVEAKPRPPEADDPRSAIARNVPPYG